MTSIFKEKTENLQQKDTTTAAVINKMLPKTIKVYVDYFHHSVPDTEHPGQKARVYPLNLVMDDIMAFCNAKLIKNGACSLSVKDQGDLRAKVVENLTKEYGKNVPANLVSNLKFKNWGDYYVKIVTPYLNYATTDPAARYPNYATAPPAKSYP